MNNNQETIIKPLSADEQYVLNKIEENNYDISNKLIEEIWNQTHQSIYKLVDQIDKKGYKLREKIREKQEEKNEIKRLEREEKRIKIAEERKRKIEEQKRKEEMEKEKKEKSTKLTEIQQKVFDTLKENNYDIGNKEISNITGVKAVSSAIREIDKKGYKLSEKIKETKRKKRKQQIKQEKEQRKELTEDQQTIYKILKENNYDISITDIEKMTKIPKKAIYTNIASIRKKGNEIKQILNLTEEKILDLYEEKEYKVTLKDLRQQNFYRCGIETLIEKFSIDKFGPKAADRVAKFIKYAGELDAVLKNIQHAEEIGYDNIGILIDELLKEDKKDKEKAIEFVINYEEILLNRGIERVEEPLYQLLIKHKVQLNKEQCLKLEELMNTYEQRVKEQEENNSNLHTKGNLKQEVRRNIEEGLEL